MKQNSTQKKTIELEPTKWPSIRKSRRGAQNKLCMIVRKIKKKKTVLQI